MERRLTMSLARRSSSWTSPSSCRATRRWQFLGAVARRRSAESASVGVPRSQSESRMWEIHMSGLMSGEGKRAGCSRTRNRAFPRLYANSTVSRLFPKGLRCGFAPRITTTGPWSRRSRVRSSGRFLPTFAIIDRKGCKRIAPVWADTGIPQGAGWRIATNHHSCGRTSSNMERL